MGLDWCASTKDDSGTSTCEIVGAPKVKDIYPTREEYCEKFKDQYKEEYLKQLMEDDEAWEQASNKYYCNDCEGNTGNICAKCPEGGIGCFAFGMGGCNLRGKAVAGALSEAGLDSSICWNDMEKQEDFERMIAVLENGIKNILDKEDGVDLSKDNEENIQWALTTLQQSKYWLNYWLNHVKNGKPVIVWAWY